MDCDSNPGYPEDFWELKCKDNLIRDTMYPQELWKDPYHGLQKVEACKNRLPKIEVPDGMVVAGGYAMYLAGWTSTYSDVDMFVIDKEKAEAYIASLGPVVGTTSCITYYPEGVRMQIILRHYKAPTEVVHGFDLDCCGILWDGTYRVVGSRRVPNLWATERAVYAHKHHVNWFDPSRASPSYAYRLSKYSLRGYTIMLPGFEEDMINHDEYKAIYDQVLDTYLDMMTSIDIDAEPEDGIIKYEGNLSASIELAKYLVTDTRLKDSLHSEGDIVDIVSRAIIQHAHLGHFPGDPLVPGDPMPLKLGMMVNALGRNIRSYETRTVRSLIPRDPVSILILAKFYSFHTGIWKQRDYDRKSGTDQEWNSDKDALTMIQWVEQNPMAQVSSTFYPTPVQDLYTWYLTSPLVKGHIPPPPREKIPIIFRRHDEDIESPPSSSDEE